MSGYKYGIAWNDSYRLGNDQVDHQHMQIFELLGKIATSCMEGNDSACLNETLNFLVSYTIRHFDDEEALQISCNFPDLLRHKQLHEDFKVTVGKLVKRYEESGSSSDLSNDVNKIVVRWLINHINGEDKKIGEYLRNIQN